MKCAARLLLLCSCAAALAITSGRPFNPYAGGSGSAAEEVIWNSKVLRLNLTHEVHCEGYNEFQGIRAEVVVEGLKIPVPTPPEFNSFLRMRCLKLDRNAVHVPVNAEFQFNVFDSRTGSRVSTNHIVVSNEPNDDTSSLPAKAPDIIETKYVTPAQHAQNEAEVLENFNAFEKVEEEVIEEAFHFSTPKPTPSPTHPQPVVSRASTLRHPSLLPLLLLLFLALYKLRFYI